MLDNADKADTLVCVSTQQEIANLLPALELRPALVLSVATEVAAEQRWPGRLQGALGNTPMEVIPVTKAVDANPEALCNLILTKLKALGERRGRVAFAWGGGQKPHGVALWLAFTHLHAAEPGAGHLATYVDQHNHHHQLLLWTSPTTQETRPLLASPMLDQVLATAGLTLSRKSEPVCLWPDLEQLPAWLDEAAALFDTEAEMRRVCFQVSAAAGEDGKQSPRERREQLEEAFKSLAAEDWLQAALDVQASGSLPLGFMNLKPGQMEQVVNRFRAQLKASLQEDMKAQAIQAPAELKTQRWFETINQLSGGNHLDPKHTRLAPDPAPNFGRLFEFLLARRIRRWAAQAEYKGEIWMNVSYEDLGRAEKDAAELDFLFLTPSGKRITIDAKTFTDRDPAEQRAQEMRFLRLGGAFSERYICFPCFDADRGGEEAEAAPWMPRPLLKKWAQWEAERADPATKRFAEKLLPYDETGLLEELLTPLVR